MERGFQTIGTVVGNTSTGKYNFVLKKFQARLGDIVAAKLVVPAYKGAERTNKNVIVWGRIVSIDRFNPFFPFEAAQELADEGIDFSDTVLSNSRDQLQAEVLILGMSDDGDSEYLLSPLTYPVQPASEVFYPDASDIQKLLAGNSAKETNIRIGSLIARGDVPVEISANKVVSRHLAVLAMTGGGKTVAVRRIIRELIELQYPLIIFDPHGDYLGFHEKASLFPGTSVKLFYPHLTVARGRQNLIFELIDKLGINLTEPQKEFLNYLIDRKEMMEGKWLKDYVNELQEYAGNIRRKKQKKEEMDLDIHARTMSVVIRSLQQVSEKLYQMKANNERLRDRFPQFTFEEMPDPHTDPELLVAKGQVSIFYLAGYDHLTQSAIVSIVLEALFAHRSALSDRIPPFQAVLEEAHNFIPSRGEKTGESPSLPTVRKLITEGRKFGTGLVLVSQRPSRLDETVLAQCNSFLVLRLVNPRDQTFVRTVMENLSDSDARLLPTFGPGQGIVSGQAVRFPLLVKIDFDHDLISKSMGDEDFINDVKKWKESDVVQQKRANESKVTRLPKGKRR